MEKQPTKLKSKILKLFPKVSSAVVTFQNPPFSPGREKRAENLHKLKGFSGPIISIIPAEAPRRSRSGNFDTQDPTSPKVSCIGQIKHKKKNSINNNKNINKSRRVVAVLPPQSESKRFVYSDFFPSEVKKKTLPALRRIFSRSEKPAGRRSDATHDKPPLPDRAPALSQVKRFASGRDSFANFDWTKVVADHRSYYSEDEKEESDGEEYEVVIPHSGPIIGVDMQPRKEVNLWQRRTMAKPKPLQLNK